MAARNQQPTYDFLTGASSPTRPPSRQPLRETFRQSQIAKPDHSNEDLRAQINTLQYELESLKQERELTLLRHEQELRDTQNKAEADFRRAQAAESTGSHATKRYDALMQELREEQDRAANEKADFERKLRSTLDSNQNITEELAEARGELESQERSSDHKYDELQTKFDAVQRGFEELRQDLNAKVDLLQATQQRLSQRETEVEDLESEIMRLKAQAGDTDTLALIKRELSDQVAHIKKLESTNRDQLGELKQLRKQHKSIEVVEEEKRSLENRLLVMNDLRKELGETQLQKQMLEDERESWSSYLENERSDDGDLHFRSPEDMARAFINERVEKASLIEQLGAIKADNAPKDGLIKDLEEEKAKVVAELEKQISLVNTATDSKTRTRLERQRTLALKEVEYLRAQLKNFDAEESEFQPDKYDAQKSVRIQELEDLLDQHRSELQSLHTQLSAQEDKENAAPTPGSKRKRTSHSPELDEAPSRRLEELRHKTRTLQEALTAQQTRNTVLEKDLAAHKTQLTSLKSSSRTRILELRSNPTTDAEALKLSTLTRLKEENAALLEQLQAAGSSRDDDDDNDNDDAPTNRRSTQRRLKSVPWPTYAGAQADIASLQKEVELRDKKMLRLRQIFAAKSSEFREAVASVLGWKMDFLPNGRVRLTSLLYPGVGPSGEGEGAEGNSIVFDGEKGEMKVSGGPRSAFFGEIRGLIEFWVDGRGTVPGFLAACTLDFYDKSTQAARM
ncbi:M protein repeat protein [Viridothelium virens]|uniref:Spindle assembly checkpoint component MAD1 n=1 Tax=Viridothelium virens TaxID=1048519 RepID=A0A6A6HIW8_VIRVR|nr:M protein repeat protein [Viridothelium virens]